MMTFVGLSFLIPLLDFCLKIQALVIFITLPLFCKCCFKRQINNKIMKATENVIQTLFGLNYFEVISFEK